MHRDDVRMMSNPDEGPGSICYVKRYTGAIKRFWTVAERAKILVGGYIRREQTGDFRIYDNNDRAKVIATYPNTTTAVADGWLVD